MAAWSWVGCDSPSKITAHKTKRTFPRKDARQVMGVANEGKWKPEPEIDNNSIIVRRAPGYFLFLWYCVLLIRRDDHDNQSDSSPVTPILRERRPGPGLAARRGAGDLQETRTPGQPASVSDLPPLWGRGVSMGSGASQISAYQVSHPKIASQIKDKNLGGDGNGKAKTIRRRHGS